MTSIKKHVRINNNILSALEQPMLTWLVRQLPAWVTPDQLTALSVIGALITATGFILANWSLTWLWLSCLGLALNWFGDSLDGALARYRCIERPRYGYFIDNISDLFCWLLIFLALGFLPGMRFFIACLGLITSLTDCLQSKISYEVNKTKRIACAGLGFTEIRMLLLSGNLFILIFGIVDLSQWITPLQFFGSVTIHELVTTLLAVLWMVLIVIFAISEAQSLALQDPPTISKKITTSRKDCYE